MKVYAWCYSIIMYCVDYGDMQLAVYLIVLIILWIFIQ